MKVLMKSAVKSGSSLFSKEDMSCSELQGLNMKHYEHVDGHIYQSAWPAIVYTNKQQFSLRKNLIM